MDDAFNQELHREILCDLNTLKELIQTNLPLLNEQQKYVFDTLMKVTNDKTGRFSFLDAPGGTGKTFLISLILAKISSQNKIALALASSGIAATFLEGSRIAHSVLKLPLNMQSNETPTCNTSKTSAMAKVLQQCELIVWDESTMAHKKSLVALDRTLQDLQSNYNPSGLLTHNLQLKVRLVVIMLRNINQPNLCNGTRLAMKKLLNNMIEATILKGKYKGEDVLIPRIPMITTDVQFEFKQLQFPVQLAFGMMIKMFQGQSFVCGINLENPCFLHGQLYVVCSRVGKPSDLFVYSPDSHLSGLIDIVDDILPIFNKCNCEKQLDGIYSQVHQIYNDISELSCEIDDIKKDMDNLEHKTCGQHSILTSLKVELGEIRKNQTETLNLLNVQTTFLQNIMVNLKEMEDAESKIDNHVDKQTGSIHNLYQIVFNAQICLKK
ncbi:unnamed protein product [Diabrotica balteata]|uniref:ATP-dependent DNA helicase n=1 Tax=Diabrotica balteata TaxID=107213 RepID=A0A9N9XDJ7_DIABA|nr:unnamed protein product [Diabrotica balteata]